MSRPHSTVFRRVLPLTEKFQSPTLRNQWPGTPTPQLNAVECFPRPSSPWILKSLSVGANSRGRMLTSDRLRSVLTYEPDSGTFRRGENPAGWMKSDGRYRMIRVDGRSYYAHRLAWLYEYGDWPACEIDHVNGNGLDNRICNLRLADRFGNTRNTKFRSNSTGFPGVSKRHSKWRSHIKINGKTKFLGAFATPEEAHAAYAAAVAFEHGEFSRFNR